MEEEDVTNKLLERGRFCNQIGNWWCVFKEETWNGVRVSYAGVYIIYADKS